jgi:signal transduction histidine kinase
METRKPRSWPSISGAPEERATEAFRRLEDMTRLISEWVWETDADGVITYVSERMFERLGRHPMQVMGMKFTDFGRFPNISEPEGPSLMLAFRNTVFICEDENGQERQFTMSAVPRFDQKSGEFIGATGIARDDTDLVRVGRANVRLADAIEVLSEHFAIYDENDRLVISNARFREFNREFGSAARPGGGFLDLLESEIAAGRYPAASDDEEAWKAKRLAARETGGSGFEVELAGNAWQLVEESRLPDGGTVMMARDISGIKHAMEALRRSAQRHRDFAADVAHKLRTPLAVLRSNIDTLGNDENTASLKREVDALARMVEQLLTLTRYENLTIFKGDNADLHEVVVQVVAALAPMAIREGKQIELDGILSPILVNGDAGALEHAIRNVVENAVKYSARGTSVRVLLDTDPPSVTVIDLGRGIPLEERNQLFERFSRLDRRGYGAGLGLSIVKTIVDAHHGEISLHSEIELGSRFAITLKPGEKAANLVQSL